MSDGPGELCVRVLRLHPEAVVPQAMSDGAAGFDLAAALDGPLVIGPGDRCAVSTGLAIAIPEGFEGQVRPRSGLARRHGVTVANAPGTVDSDYRGTLEVLLINLGRESVTIESGQRIAQLVIAAVARPSFDVVDSLDVTSRGSGGFGSTGS